MSQICFVIPASYTLQIPEWAVALCYSCSSVFCRVGFWCILDESDNKNAA